VFRLACSAIRIGRGPAPARIYSAARLTDRWLARCAGCVMAAGFVIDAFCKGCVGVSFVASHWLPQPIRNALAGMLNFSSFHSIARAIFLSPISRTFPREL
jgi:hypothetical protein